MNLLNVGLLGYGMAGRVFHAPLITACPDLHLHRIASRDFTGKTPPEGVKTGTIQQVIDDPDIDLIVIATPNDSHAPLAHLALEAGKHVVIDKPFAITLTEADAVIAHATQAGKMVSVFHNRRWDGGFLTAQAVLDSGQLGEISYAEMHFDRLAHQIKDRWREWDVPGAGLLYDLGPHLIDQLVCLFGQPDRATAHLARQRPGAIVDDFFHVMLEFGDIRAVAHASSLMAPHGPRIALHGRRGSFFQYGFDGQEEALKNGGKPGDPGWSDTPNGRACIIAPGGGETPVGLLPGTYEAYYAGIAQAIHTNTAPPVTAQGARETMALIASLHG